MTWKPHVTVASIVEQDGRFLMVEERVDGRLCLNQPAGHLEDGESLLAAAIRESREETAWTVVPQALVGVYRWRGQDRTFLRFAFLCRAEHHDVDAALDQDIERTCWLTYDELEQRLGDMRSPLVMRCLEDYQRGQRFPLELLQDVPSIPVV